MSKYSAPEAASTRDAAMGTIEPMANPEHLIALRADIDEWNRWRADNQDLTPDLTGADLNGVNLVLADLTHALLRNADLTMANLKGADLRWSDLRGANLVGARLIGAELEGADIRGANLSTAEDLTAEQLAETVGDGTTLIPDETPRPLRWSAEPAAR